MNTKPLNDKSTKQNKTQFVFSAPAALRVSLAGDFNNWNPEGMPMYKGFDGVWYLNVLLTPGRHEYRFIADGVWKDDPAAKQRTANTMGSENCIKTVSAEINGAQAMSA